MNDGMAAIGTSWPSWYRQANAGHHHEAIASLESDGSGALCTPIADLVLGKCYLATGQYQKASVHLDRAIAARPNDVAPRLLRVEILREVGEVREALQQLLAVRDLPGGDQFVTQPALADVLTEFETQLRADSVASVRSPGSFPRAKRWVQDRFLVNRVRRAIMGKRTLTKVRLRLLRAVGADARSARFPEGARGDLENSWVLGRISSVEEYVARSGDRFLYFGAPDRIAFATPCDWRKGGDAGSISFDGNAAYVAALRDVTVSARSNFVYGRNGELVSDTYAHPQYGQYVSSRGEEGVFLRMGRGVVLRRRPLTRRVERAIHLCGLASSHYGHWFSEYLPRLRHFEKLTDFADIPIMVNADMPPTHFEFLASICSNPLIRLADDDEVNVGELLVAPTITYYPFDLLPGHKVPHEAQASWSAQALVFLRDRVLSRLNPPVQNKSAIYLSRRNSTWAKVTNEPELEQGLAALGVEPVLLEMMSFADQVACMQNAGLIIAHTGSALNNVVFASTDTRILVFTHAPTHNWGGWLGPMREIGFDPKFHLVPIEDTDKKHVNMEFDVDEIRAAVLAVSEGQRWDGR